MQRQLRDVGVDAPGAARSTARRSAVCGSRAISTPCCTGGTCPPTRSSRCSSRRDRTPPRGPQHQLLRGRFAHARALRVGPHGRPGASARDAARGAAAHRRAGAGDPAVQRHPARRGARDARRFKGNPTNAGLLERARVGQVWPPYDRASCRDVCTSVPSFRIALRRIAQSIPLLLIVSVLVFALIHAAPGGPLASISTTQRPRPRTSSGCGARSGSTARCASSTSRWLAAFVRGDWGFSYADGRPVPDRMLERLPATLELVGVVARRRRCWRALPSGIASAARRGAAVRSHRRRRRARRLFAARLLVRARAAAHRSRSRSAGCRRPDARRSATAASPTGSRHLVAARAPCSPRCTRPRGRATCAPRCRHASRSRSSGAARRARHPATRRASAARAATRLRRSMLTVVLLDAAIMVSGAVVTESVFAWPARQPVHRGAGARATTRC